MTENRDPHGFLDNYEERLVDSGTATRKEIAHAHNVEAVTGIDFDDVLATTHTADLTDIVVQKADGEYESIILAETHADQTLFTGHSGQFFLAKRWLPVRRTDGRLLVAAARPVDTACREEVESYFGEPVDFAMTTSWDLNQELLRVYAQDISVDSSFALYRSNPALSAKTVLDKRQKIVLIIVLVLIIAAVIANPILALVVFLAVLGSGFFLSIAYKFYICALGARHEGADKISDETVAAMRDEDLPIYTVLVPVFREEKIVAQLVENLGGIDYPKEKLEVLILTEEEDQLTRDAIYAANPPTHFHVITVPKGVPQTKPRACNVGLYFASGEFLVIYDAEDKPEADQLKRAVAAFRAGAPELVCVQAALNYFNDDENFLTRMFTLEYSFWFDYMLTGLEEARMPIPLGGTSNHFKTDMLRTLGGWDAWNVTEDADLGIRASALGYTVGTINSTTMEEANNSMPNFVRQRSRWIKGYIQTTLVHLRQPIKLVQAAGLKQALGFLFLIGGTPACFLAVLPLYLVTLVTFFVDRHLLTQYVPVWVLVLCLVNFFLGNALMIHISMVGPFKRKRWRLVTWALLNPLYWLLHSIASYKALWQLIVNPHYWEKTDHGLTTHTVGAAEHMEVAA